MARSKSTNTSKSKATSPETDVMEIDSDTQEEDLNEEEGEEVYHVEVITAARVAESDNGEIGWQYFVKWANYPDSVSSWEPASNVRGCKDLLEDFWTHIGTDDNDYPVDYEVHAKKQWINKKKEFFLKTFQPPPRKKTKNEEKGQNSANRKKKVQVGKSVKSTSKSKKQIILIDTSDDDDRPLAESAVRLKQKLTSSLTALKRAHPTDDEAPSSKPKSQKSRENSDVKDHSSSSKGDKTKLSQSESSADDLFSGPDSSFEVVPSTSLQTETVSEPIHSAQTTTSLTTQVGTRGVPLHRQRQNNPQVKLLDLSPERIRKGSTLSTKSRVAHAPSIVPATAPSFFGRKSAISHLSFKKKIQKPTMPSAVAKKPPPEPQLPNFVPEVPTIEPESQNHASAHLSPVQDLSESTLEPILTTSMEDRAQEVDNFLFSIMPEELSAPLKPQEEREAEVGVLPKVKPSDMIRIPKKWKWSGELFVSTSAAKAERLCDVTIQDPTEHKPDGLRFSLFFQNTDSMRLNKLHDNTDLNMILPSFGAVHQFARLVPREAKDKNALDVLSKYMSSRKKITYSPLSFANEVTLDANVAAFLLVFPLLDDLCSRFDVPEDMRQGDGLLVALLPPKLKLAKYRELQWRKPTWFVSHKEDEPIASLSDRCLKDDPAYALALRILDFPQWLHRFIIPERTYCVWFAPVDGTQEDYGMKIKGKTDTQALVTILTRTKARNVGYKADVRVVFVHIGALRTLYRLPAYCERKFRRPEIQFILYGKHPTVPKNRWGIREIYIQGGVVTFTPNAILNDPYGIVKLIRKIYDHALYECYILPSVLGLVMGVAQEMDDAFIYELVSEDLCKAIENGELALLDPPPMESYPTMDLDQDLAWVKRQLSLPRESTRFLSECRAVYNKKYANLSPRDRQSSIIEAISIAMLSMQLQPTITDNYRRFIVVADVADEKVKVSPGDSSKTEPVLHDWLEWQTLSSFKFKDKADDE